jgi:putrescine transport system permease protein
MAANEIKISRLWRRADWRRQLTISIPYLWLVCLCLVPFVIVAKISLSHAIFARPPYTPLVTIAESGSLQSMHATGPVSVSAGIYIQASLDNFLALFQDGIYGRALVNSLRVAAISTLFCLLLGYPIAYGIARLTGTLRNVLLLLVVLPFWTSFLIRVFAWIALLDDHGIINAVLLGLGIIHEPIKMLFTSFAIYVGIVYCYLPFMVLPLYANIEKIDFSLLEAAGDLGATPASAFLRVTLPLSLSGIAAGCILVFVPAMGEYVIPQILGGPNNLMIGHVLWNEFALNRNWPMAAAIALAVLVFVVVPAIVVQQLRTRQLRQIDT